MDQTPLRSYPATSITEARVFIEQLEAEVAAIAMASSGGLRQRFRSLLRVGRAAATVNAESLRQQTRTTVDEIVSILSESLHPSQRRLLRQIPVGVVRTGTPYPFPIRTPSGVPAILIDSYLTRFIELSNKISLCTNGWKPDEIRNVSLVNVQSLLFGEPLDTSRSNSIFESMQLPSPEALEMFGKLNKNQHLFAIAQMFSHWLLGHLENATVLARVLHPTKSKVDEICRTRDAEFAADAHATNWCRTIFEKTYPSLLGDDARVELSLQCGEILLLYCRVAEVVEKNLGIQSANAQRSALERLDRIRRESRINMLETFETFYFESIFPETSAAARMEGKFPFCDWYMEHAKTLTPEQIVEHFASCPRCGLTYDYLMAGVKAPR